LNGVGFIKYSVITLKPSSLVTECIKALYEGVDYELSVNVKEAHTIIMAR